MLHDPLTDTMECAHSTSAGASSASSRTDELLTWLAGQPLVPPAVGMVAGIGLDAAWHVPVAAGAATFIAAGAVVLRFRGHEGYRHLAVAVAALAVGAALHDLSFRRFAADHVVRYCGPTPTPARLTGTIIDAPALQPVNSGTISWYQQLPSTRLLLSAEAVEGIAGPIFVSGTVSVVVREPVLNVSAGDRVELFGTMYRPSPPVNPGEKNWSLIQRRRGVLVEMSCPHAANVRVVAGGSGGVRWLASIRRRGKAAMLDNTFPGDVPGSRLLSALVLGQRSAVDPKLNDAFTRTGTVHYLSVSGAHVGMLASFVWLVGVATGRSRRGCALIAMVAVTAYAVLAEPRAPILRSAIMADLLCVAILLRRPVRTANWLALSLLVLLPVMGATELFNPGFQMSYATLIALIYLSPRVHEVGVRVYRRALRRDDPLLSPQIQRMLNPPSPARLAGQWLTVAMGWWLAIGVSAWAVSIPLAAYHFGQLATWGWLNTILIMPVVWLVLVLGLVKTVVTAAVPWVGQALGSALSGFTEVLVDLVSLLDRFPASGLVTPETPGWLVASGLAVATVWCVRGWLRLDGRWVGVAGLSFAIAAAWRLAPAGPRDELRYYVLSVGSGTTSVLRLPNGATILYDAGSFPPYDLNRWTLGPLLAHERVYHIDAAVISHANLDHFCGLPDVLKRRHVDRVMLSPHFPYFASPGDAAARTLETIDARGVPRVELTRGQRLSGTGDVSVEVLWPPPLEEEAIRRVNDSSVVLRVTYGGRRLLLCGDVQDAAQRALMRDTDLKADVLVLPHHGGVVRSTRAFIDAVDPEVCIRSNGQPDAETTNGILEIVEGRRYFNTADDGAVEVRVRGGDVVVKAWRDRAD